jgi:hypothetical protein
MREFLVLVIFIAAVLFIGPIILSIVFFALVAAAILLLLARFGILPGVYVKRSKVNTKRGKSSYSWKWKSQPKGSRREEGWYSTPQDGEEIILPESALRKEKDPKKNRR